jgi:erythronate-4-phosphate dehydrogenase
MVRAHGLLLDDLTIGIIGVGSVGREVLKKCASMGMNVLLNDPPRAMSESDSSFIPLDPLLAEADIVTFHVPLEDRGKFATRHLADHRFFEKVQLGALFVNASRGEVVDSDALLAALDSGTVRAAVLDVWEHEPSIRLDVLDRVDLGTAHIAGHSHEGKLNGTLMLYEEACRFFEMPRTFNPAHHVPDLECPGIDLDARGCLDQDLLWNAVRIAYDIEEDNRQLREGAVPDDRARGGYFSGLRRNYGVRREFPAFEVGLRHGSGKQREKLKGLGFRVLD